MVDLKIELPDGFLDEEVRCGYTVTRKMKEVWAVELDLLTEFDRVCNMYNIKYFADGGTILGAIRHSGFIPWDDDIDIAMNRAEYEKLCKYSYEFKSPYFFQTEYTDKSSLRGHAQLRNSCTTAIVNNNSDFRCDFNQGIFIDIFPLDNVCDDSQKFNKQIKKIKYFKNIAYKFGRWNSKPTSKVKVVIKRFIYRFPFCKSLLWKLERICYRKFERECQLYNQVETEKMSVLSFCCDLPRLIRMKSSYIGEIMMPFEFISIPVPIGYEEILTNLYGNYQKIVMNSSLHGNVLFDTEISYKDYLKKYRKEMENKYEKIC